ncbi:MAG: hypothetical protein RLZZ399_2340 [Verrucomicrobiota bacterium]|jgi:formylglycine-generating enzyme required for sulfatase activity
MNPWLKLLVCLLSASVCVRSASAAPTVSNVTFAPRADGSRLVDVFYDLSDDWAGATSSIALAVSSDGGATYVVPVKSVTGAVGDGVTAGTGKRIVWDAGTDWPGQSSSQIKVQVRAWDLRHEGGYGFVRIPGGNYQIGNLMGDSDLSYAPVTSVMLSGFYLAAHQTTKAQWDVVFSWATGNGYTFANAGAGKASHHPVQRVSWHDAVKWANAASEKEGLTPCYRVGGQVYRTGNQDSVTCDWGANGYRLPTEAEWEVAARGGLSGKRFPWGDTITHGQANYYSSFTYSYDVSPTRGYHPTYATGNFPYTSPVGSFAANGYGLYDMAGNVFQWCWDVYGAYSGGSDPRGAASGSWRVLRGGNWIMNEDYARCAQRFISLPAGVSDYYGFRLARGRP